MDWLANFALIEVFPVWQNAVSLGGVMVCFAALAFAAIVFVYPTRPGSVRNSQGSPIRRRRSQAVVLLCRGTTDGRGAVQAGCTPRGLQLAGSR